MGIIDDFTNRESEKPDAIKAGALNLTIVSVFFTVIAGSVTVLTGLIGDLFNGEPGPTIRLGFIAALVLAASAMVVADVLARSRVAAAVARSTHVFTTEGDGLPAQVRDPNYVDENGHPNPNHLDAGYHVDMIEVNGANGVVRYHVKGANGSPPSWHAADEVVLTMN